MILKPGTGTNPYYARKHGHEIPNTLDKVLAGLCSEYQPTGATNSIDAAEMLCKGERIEFATSAPSAPPQVAPRSYTPSHETFGTRSTPAAPPRTLPVPQKQEVDPQAVLSAGHGWSEQDSQRQLQALQYCQGDKVGHAFDQSVRLGESCFRKSGWSAALTTASLVAGVGALVTAFSNPGLALGLASGALASAGGSALLNSSARQDHNNGQILSDMGRRLDAKSWGQDYPRQDSHGNYLADFYPSK